MEETIGLPHFNCDTDISSIGQKWLKWKRAFEIFIEAKGLTDNARKKALLLHHAGMALQEIFFSLPVIQNQTTQEENENPYQQAIKALDNYFLPKCNIPFERHLFRSISQRETETIDQFVLKLRKQSENCNFTNPDEEIRDQIIQNCHSRELRRRLLEKGNTTLRDILDAAHALEALTIQSKQMDKNEGINKIVLEKNENKALKPQFKGAIICYRCGFSGHTGKDQRCPALNKECKKCGNLGHFSRCCKTKAATKHQNRNVTIKHKNKNKTVHTVETIENSTKNDFTFRIDITDDDFGGTKIECEVGGVKLDMLIDSGASCNVIDQQTWEFLKSKKVKCISNTPLTDKRLYAYGSEKPLSIIGKFMAEIKIQNAKEVAEIFVIRGKGKALLGCNTAKKLGILKLGYNAENSKIAASLRLSDRPCFRDSIGKLKNFQIVIPVRKDAQPVSQPYRRVPIAIQAKVENRLEELVKEDIIEPVEGPSAWVSPIVPIMNGDEVRLCIDMRQANLAIERERHPLPTIENLISEIYGSTVFSKLDIRKAFHQLEVSPESREIMTFITHKGLFRFKRLLFGVNCAPELFQKTMEQLLSNCEGCVNFIDDILVYGTTKEEHDKRLEEVLKVFDEKGLTLNKNKCIFGASEVTFLGHILSKDGIKPAEDKVKSIREFREPTTLEELRSFLGLVNFVGKFVPNLSTIAEPLWRVTGNKTKFIWGKEQSKSFNRLKNCLSSETTLGYYLPEHKTQVMADASRVGLGAVLIQVDEQGKPRVICYANKTLTETEKRYSQTEKEALALVWAVEKFNNYLFGKEFDLITDHRPLEVIFGPKSKPCARIERWVLRLQTYRYNVLYKKGTQNIADPLSRLCNNTKQPDNMFDSLNEHHVYGILNSAIPRAMTLKEIEKACLHDEEISKVVQGIETGNFSDDLNNYKFIQEELCVAQNIVLRGTRVVIPKQLRERVLALAHEGHPGIVAMKGRLRTKVWWPKIDKNVEDYCKKCYGCQVVSQPDPPEPMNSRKLPEGPWQELAMDCLGPLPSAEYLFVVTDYYSRFMEVGVIKEVTAETIITILKNIFARFGLPISITTDNAKAFTGHLFEEFCNENNIKHLKTTPYWPQANGEVERQNRSLLKRLRIAQTEKRDWKDELLKFLFMSRTTPHATTGVSPSELMFNRKLRDKIPTFLTYREISIDRQEVRDRDLQKKFKAKAYTDKRRRARTSNLRVGNKVLMKQLKRNKLAPTFHPEPMTIVKINDGSRITVESSKGQTFTRNSSFFKKYISNSDLEENTDSDLDTDSDLSANTDLS